MIRISTSILTLLIAFVSSTASVQQLSRDQWGAMPVSASHNAGGLKDRAFAEDMLKRGAEMENGTIELESEIMATVNDKIAA